MLLTLIASTPSHSRIHQLNHLPLSPTRVGQIMKFLIKLNAVSQLSTFSHYKMQRVTVLVNTVQAFCYTVKPRLTEQV